MISYADIEAEVFEQLRALRVNDSATVTTWIGDKMLCFVITGSHSGQSCRMVRRQLKNMAKRQVVMWKVINGEMFWALNEGQFRGAPVLNSGDMKSR